MSIQGNNIPVFATSIQNNVISVPSSQSLGSLGIDSNGVQLYTAGANGSRVYSLFISTTDTVAGNVYLYIVSSLGAVCPIGQINIPASSGNIANKLCVNALAAANCSGLPFDGTEKPYIELGSRSILKISLTSTITTGKAIYASVIGADY